MYYGGGNPSTPSQVMPFPGQQHQQQQFQTIPTYAPQQPFLVQQSTSNMYPQQNTQFVPMNITSQTNQGYVEIANAPVYANSRYPTIPQPQQPQAQQNAYRYDRNQSVPVPSGDDRCRKQLIVNYLAPNVTSADLQNLFARYGPLDGARIIYDKQTNMPRGYGFVYFHFEQSAKEAVERMNGFEFHGKRLRVSYSNNPLNYVSSTVNAMYPQQTGDGIQ